MAQSSDQEPVFDGNEKRIAANRKNAQKSTGPRTAAGKAKTSQNATKHGVWALQTFAVTRGNFKEDEREVLNYVDSIVESLAPADPLQYALARNIAMLCLRLRRVGFLEADALNARGLSDGHPTLSETAWRADKVDATSIADWIIGEDDTNCDFIAIVPILVNALGIPHDVLEQAVIASNADVLNRSATGIEIDEDQLPNALAQGVAEHILNTTFRTMSDSRIWAFQFELQTVRELERAAARRGRQAQAALQHDIDKSSQISGQLLRQFERALAAYRKLRGEEGE